MATQAAPDVVAAIEASFRSWLSTMEFEADQLGIAEASLSEARKRATEAAQKVLAFREWLDAHAPGSVERILEELASKRRAADPTDEA